MRIDDARLAEIRERIIDRVSDCFNVNPNIVRFYMEGCMEEYDAEVDRLRAEIATVTAERDRWLGHVANADAEGSEATTRYDALRTSYTWTVATPATMPPTGSGPWLVELEGGQRYRECEVVQGYKQKLGPPLGEGVRGIQTVDDLTRPISKWKANGATYDTDETRFAAMPAELEARDADAKEDRN